jgi:hypothetical protein
MKSKAVKASLYIIAIISIIIIALSFYGASKLDSLIANFLKDAVTKGSKGSYRLYLDVNTDIIANRINLKNVRIEEVNKNSKKTAYYLSFDADFISPGILRFIRHKELDIRSIKLFNPVIYIYQSGKNDSSTVQISIYEGIKKRIRELSIKKISINNADFRIFRPGTDSAFISFKENDIVLRNFKVNEQISKANRLFVADSATVLMKNIAWTTTDKIYQLKCRRLIANYNDSIIQLEGLSMNPLIPKKQFSKQLGFQTDCFNVEVPTMQFNSIDIKTLIESGNIICKTIQIEKLKLNAYRDKNVQRREHVYESLQQLIGKLPVIIRLDDIQIANADIIYEELAINADKPGRVSFNNLNAVIDLGKDDLGLNADGKVMGFANLHCRMIFPLKVKETYFRANGRMGTIDFDKFNVITESNANLTLKSGKIDSLNFNFIADHNYAHGTLNMYYNNLKIEVRSKPENPRAPVNALFSFLANNFIIKGSNPEPDGKIRVGTISYARNPQRFIFNYSWNALLSGISNTLIAKESKFTKK